MKKILYVYPWLLVSFTCLAQSEDLSVNLVRTKPAGYTLPEWQAIYDAAQQQTQREIANIPASREKYRLEREARQYERARYYAQPWHQRAIQSSQRAFTDWFHRNIPWMMGTYAGYRTLRAPGTSSVAQKLRRAREMQRFTQAMLQFQQAGGTAEDLFNPELISYPKTFIQDYLNARDRAEMQKLVNAADEAILTQLRVGEEPLTPAQQEYIAGSRRGDNKLELLENLKGTPLLSRQFPIPLSVDDIDIPVPMWADRPVLSGERRFYRY